MKTLFRNSIKISSVSPPNLAAVGLDYILKRKESRESRRLEQSAKMNNFRINNFARKSKRINVGTSAKCSEVGDRGGELLASNEIITSTAFKSENTQREWKMVLNAS